MSRKLDLKIGQSVAIRKENKKAKKALDNIDKWVLKGAISKVGRKYVTVEVGDKYKREIIFNMEDDYREKYDIGRAEYKLFLSKQDIIDDFNSEALYSEIRNKFNNYYNHGKFNLKQLKKIIEIINE